MIKLYNYDLSVNCYKLRLMMSLLDVEYESIDVSVSVQERAALE